MAEIVGGFATSHILMSSKGVEARAMRVASGMAAIGKELRSRQPDLIVLVTNDHMFNFSIELQAPFIIGAAETYTPFGDLNVPRESRPGNSAFALDFMSFAAKAGFDLGKALDIAPDHGVAVPLLFADPSRTIPVVPLYVNLMMKPMPSPQRIWALGETLRRYITTECKFAQRVAVVGAGGLSHWVGLERVDVNEEWDRAFLNDMRDGRFLKWVAKSANEIEGHAGNGGLEVLHWLFMAAAVDARGADIAYYEPMVEWMTGMGGIIAR